MLKRYLLIGVFAVSFVAFTSCTKVEDNIHHAWLMESMMSEETNEIIWDFKTDGSVIRMIDAGEIIDTAYYTIDKKVTYTSLRIIESESYAGMNSVNGFFRIDKINDQKLVITRYEMEDETTDGAYLRREFTKIN
jgi:hypothetical protein